ncbi:MAG TPA: protein phosphatase 2C domain-containing protein [Thermoanaerobaculaceae bacterium]|nr:protein phosphatase 2C domain-containing protein [Thermoanaerobaculaceae bacterium]HRS16718.1 protein phosphatase 2C domain-containing protein [Thermoanaerobaculaceae bacterium]
MKGGSSHLTLAAATHPGRRSNQEDAWFARRVGPEAWLVVADGMGGHAAGEVASRLVVEAFEAAIPARGQDPGRRLEEAAATANAAILAHGAAHPDSEGLGSTVVAAVVRDGRAVVGHAGDSRAWVVTPDEVVQITRDHSAMQDALDRGEHAGAELARSPYRHAILRSLGDAAFAGLERTPPAGAMALSEGSILLLTTDGAHGFLTPAEMLEHLAGTPSLADGLEHLVRKAYANGSDDNITVVGCEVGRFPRSRVAAQAPPAIPRPRRRVRRVPRLLPLALGGVLLTLLALLGALLARALQPSQASAPGEAGEGAVATATPAVGTSPGPAPAVVVATAIPAPTRPATRAAAPGQMAAAGQQAAQRSPVPTVPTPEPTAVGGVEGPAVVLPPPVDMPPAATAEPRTGRAAASPPSASQAASKPGKGQR